MKPTSSGQLSKTPFSHLLVYAFDRKLTGTLDFQAPVGTATLRVISGQPTKLRTTFAPTYLGRVMLELGYITTEQHDTSLVELSKKERLHGEIMLGKGYITASHLRDALIAQLRRNLDALWRSLPPETTFDFFDGYDGLSDWGGSDATSIDPWPTAWAAIREMPSWDHAQSAIERLEQGRIRFAVGAQVERFDLLPEENRLLDLLRVRPMKMNDLIAQAEKLGPRVAQLLLYCLAITKQIEITADPIEQVSGVELPDAPMSAKPPSPLTVARVALKSRAVAKSSPAVEEHHFDQSRDRRATDEDEPEPPSTPEEVLQRRERIMAAAATIDGHDYFTMLGVSQTATTEEVKAAYFRLAKEWHPDRLPAELADAKDACARVFARMSEAHQTLTDEDKRKRYADLMVEGGATPESQEEIARILEASVSFQKAEIFFKRNDLAQAEQLLLKALALDDSQAETIALLAWIQALKPDAQGGEATQVKIKQLDLAIMKNPRCERAYFYRGMLYKRTQRDGLAYKDFKKVIELNPRNIDAQREVRLYDMRGGPPRRITPAPSQYVPPKPGLFQKFFKK